jgi:hypothetical protein
LHLQTSFQPWLDFEHRRYWVAESDSNLVGILVLTSIHRDQYQIKNAVSFPNAPRGTSEMVIYRAMSDIQDEGTYSDDSDRNSEDGTLVWTNADLEVARKIEEKSGHSRSQSTDSSSSGSLSRSDSSSGNSTPSTNSGRGGVAVTFGITASDSLTPVDNLSGWKITWLSKTYNKVIGLTGLTRRGDFRVRTCMLTSFHALGLTFFPRRTSSTRSTCRCTSATPPRTALASMG